MKPTENPEDSEEPGGGYPCLDDDRLLVRLLGKFWIAACSDVKRVLWSLFVTCGVLVAVDLAFLSPRFDRHAQYNWENWVAFYAVYGFVSCTVLVLVAKFILRPLVIRDEDYYD